MKLWWVRVIQGQSRVYDEFSLTLGGSARLRLAPTWADYSAKITSGTVDAKVTSGTADAKTTYGTYKDEDYMQEIS